MRVCELDYELPKGLIAVYPPQDRPSAHLLFFDRKTNQIQHRSFREVAGYFLPGDVLVLNNSKVLPARLLGKKSTGGKVEALLLDERAPGEWTALLKPGSRVKKGSEILFGENGHPIQAKVLNDSSSEFAERLLSFEPHLSRAAILKIGHMPIPPYLNREDELLDREFYQTVYAEKEGSVAAPTAGLHFDQSLLEELKVKGVEIVCVTLHVNYATFHPVTAETIVDHPMHEESFEITEAAAQAINRAKSEGRRIIACGTTSVRVLESALQEGKLMAGSGKTKLLIYPPYSFQIVDGLITNFHLPRSTLLFLVAAFMGKENLLKTYEEAIRERYRFYSYGDAMLIL